MSQFRRLSFFLHRMRYNAFLASTSCLCLGCAYTTEMKDELLIGFKTYIEPSADQNHALARVTGQGVFVAYPQSKCTSPAVERSGLALHSSGIGIRASSLNGQKREMLQGSESNLPAAEMRIPSDQPFTLHYRASWPSGTQVITCNAVRTFTPKKDSQYEVRGVTDHVGNTCGVLVNEISPAKVEVPTIAALRCAA